MPIYAYRCATCGHAKDVLQKLSDPVLTACPACGADTFLKQVTAAGFQLKGSGWYVTDFKGGASTAPPVKTDDAAKPAGTEPAAAAPADKPAATGSESAAAAPAPAPAPAATPKPSTQGGQ